MNKVIQRMKEPSTMAGLAVLSALFGVPGLDQAIGQTVAGIAAVASIIMKEKGTQ